MGTIDQAELAAHLGFDPESPLVKTEISQIIAQGMAQQGSGTKMDSILGVDEAEGRKAAADVEMEDILVAENVPLEETVVEAAATVEAVNLIVGFGGGCGGWDERRREGNDDCDYA